MADWNELLSSPDFRQYQIGLAKEIAKFLNTNLSQTECDREFFSGALCLTKKVLNFPLELTKDENLREIVNRNIKESFASITVHLMRE